MSEVIHGTDRTRPLLMVMASRGDGLQGNGSFHLLCTLAREGSSD
jgi:hypothetical protein